MKPTAQLGFLIARGGMDSQRNFFVQILSGLLHVTVILLLVGQAKGDDMKDVNEGDNVTLECRFGPHLISRGRETLFWFRTNNKDKDNVAIGETPLDTNYAIDYRPAEGRYDLRIHNATYDRDNGKFECRIKASGSGQELHSKVVQLTVLLPPGEVKVIPSEPTATEGRVLELTCSSSGGSPDPLIRWYRNGMNYPLDSIVKNGGSRWNPTSAILSVTPVRDDDGTEYRCVVWNRALGEGVKLEKTVTLNVNYFPRVKVGPENPLKVEKGSPAKLHCNVDAKPAVSSVRWTRNGKFSETTFTYLIPRTGLSDAGTYQCSAENGLGQSGEADLTLDVLYAPIVSVTSTKEYAEGETAWIKCNVTSNPKPSSIEWIKKDDPSFHHYGDILKIESVISENAGIYICKATNILNPSGDIVPYERTGNASVTLLIKHAPGKSVIEPAEPYVVEGSGVTMTCRADPPGWPAPGFRWWREGSESTISIGAQFNLGSAKVTSEGRYYCQPNNEIGTGTVTSVYLSVYQPPRITSGLNPQQIKRVNDKNYSVHCGATGVPRPTVTWLKDGVPLDANPNFNSLYTVSEKVINETNRLSVIQSTLSFAGENRDGISADDRGYYTCVFENEVKKEESHMFLRIQHEPIVRHRHDMTRVAFDLSDTAAIPCKVQAFPKPDFHWKFNSIPLNMDIKNYESNITQHSNDIYVSTLYVKGVREEDYGEYACFAANSMGNATTVVSLQKRGPPFPPVHIDADEVGTTSVLLRFEPGFNGGYENTKYNLSYYSQHNVKPVEYDCHNYNPCNITGLEQKTVYVFKVKSYNPKGSSGFSPSTRVVTKVDLASIPAPTDVKFEPKSQTLISNYIGPTPIRAKVEVQDEEGSWRKVRMLVVDGNSLRTTIEDSMPVPNVRLTLCVDEETDVCGKGVIAQLVSDIPATAPVGIRPHYVIAGVVSGIVLLLCLALILIFCCCRKRKVVKKDYETGRGHQTQVVPPPYYTNGMENKGLERSMDIMEDPIKNFNGQGGYVSYNGHMNNGNGTIPYIDQNSYSNSNNGGSVDSQDSLWKVSQAPHEQLPQQSQIQNTHPHVMAQHRSNYEQQYAPTEDPYMPYEARNNYVTDPYGPIPKPKRRLDLIGDHSPYHELSGLPDPYMESNHDEQSVRTQQGTMSFEESLENGYSTPSSRSRRVIREIIV